MVDVCACVALTYALVCIIVKKKSEKILKLCNYARDSTLKQQTGFSLFNYTAQRKKENSTVVTTVTEIEMNGMKAIIYSTMYLL